MRKFILAAALMAPVAAYAQAPAQAPNYDTQALGQTVIDLTSQSVALKAKLLEADAQVKALQAENKSLKDAAQKPAVDSDKK